MEQGAQQPAVGIPKKCAAHNVALADMGNVEHVGWAQAGLM
jgi:hypothetical protein